MRKSAHSILCHVDFYDKTKSFLYMVWFFITANILWMILFLTAFNTLILFFPLSIFLTLYVFSLLFNRIALIAAKCSTLFILRFAYIDTLGRFLIDVPDWNSKGTTPQ